VRAVKANLSETKVHRPLLVKTEVRKKENALNKYGKREHDCLWKKR